MVPTLLAPAVIRIASFKGMSFLANTLPFFNALKEKVGGLTWIPEVFTFKLTNTL
jgi:hypothetical protein